jgi:hypothetical protein
MTVELAAKRYKRTGTIYVIGDIAFVANPTTRSAWWKTHASVAFASCPTCKAAAGVRCTPSFGFDQGRTHETRRHLLPKSTAPVAKLVIHQAPPEKAAP